MDHRLELKWQKHEKGAGLRGIMVNVCACDGFFFWVHVMGFRREEANLKRSVTSHPRNLGLAYVIQFLVFSLFYAGHGETVIGNL